MKKLMLLHLLILFSIISCTNSKGAQELLEKEGYTNIQITGYRFFTCSKEDELQTGFIAKKGDKIISGTVCEGLLFKGKTIRYD